MRVSPNQWTILERLEKGPEWIRSFQPAKPLLNDLIDKGLVERCRPHLGRANNMVRLTVTGCEKLEIDLGAVPSARERKVVSLKPARSLGKIKAGLSDQVRSVCEAFVHAVTGGERESDVVLELAAMHGVQRPAIWRRLRSGGVLPEYQQRQANGRGRPVGGGEAGYTARRRERALQAAVEGRLEPSPDQFVDRDPCPRCGVRADLGCGHSQTRLGMIL